MFSPAFCHAQLDCPIDDCGGWQATITSVSPTTWIAGQTTTVTINGFYGAIDFLTVDNNVMIPVSIDSLMWPYNPSCDGNIPDHLCAYGPFPQYQWQYKVTPDASNPTETATIWPTWGDCIICAWPVTATVQIKGCTPTITSISPSTWLAGETYKNVEIAGTNFITADQAIEGCPMTQLAVTAATGGVTVSDVIVSSDTKITATVKPDDDDPTEPATVIAKNGSVTGTGTAQINGLPPAKIEWNGDEISGTTQTAVVGQKIDLKAKPKEDLAEGYTLSKSTWVVDPTNIGELQEPAGNHGFNTSDTVLNKPDTSFYWLAQANGLNASYTYCATVPSGREVCPQTTKATATFNVSGPVSLNLYTCGGAVTGCTENGPLAGVNIISGPKLGLGNKLLSIRGIEFSASDDSSSPPGDFSFVQTLQNLEILYNYDSGIQCTVNGSGLDNRYPYPSASPTSTNDSPNAPLFDDDTEVTENMHALMYLLWKSSSTSDSIPVTLGYVDWSWFGDAVRGNSTPAWSIKPDSGSQGNAQSFQVSTTYPQWTIVYHNPTNKVTEESYHPCLY